jgi:hypothetical protein
MSPSALFYNAGFHGCHRQGLVYGMKFLAHPKQDEYARTSNLLARPGLLLKVCTTSSIPASLPSRRINSKRVEKAPSITFL